MTTNWFHGTGAFSPDELAEFIGDYQRYGGANWVSKIDLGDDVPERTSRLVNGLTQDMGRLTDRLALTIVDLSKRRFEKHSGDCSIYSSLINNTPEAGVCTCGYGLQVMRKTGNHRDLYSTELIEKLMCVGGGNI